MTGKPLNIADVRQPKYEAVSFEARLLMPDRVNATASEVQTAIEQVAKETPSGSTQSSDSIWGFLGLSSASSVIITAQQVLMHSMPVIAYAIFTLFAGVCLLIAFIKVLYVSPGSLAALKDFELSCDNNTNCVYGPFGPIVENYNSFFLVHGK